MSCSATACSSRKALTARPTSQLSDRSCVRARTRKTSVVIGLEADSKTVRLHVLSPVLCNLHQPRVYRRPRKGEPFAGRSGVGGTSRRPRPVNPPTQSRTGNSGPSPASGPAGLGGNRQGPASAGEGTRPGSLPATGGPPATAGAVPRAVRGRRPRRRPRHLPSTPAATASALFLVRTTRRVSGRRSCSTTNAWRLKTDRPNTPSRRNRVASPSCTAR